MSDEQEVSTQPEFPSEEFNSQLPEAPVSPEPSSPVESGLDDSVMQRAESLGMTEKDFEGMSPTQAAATIDRAEAIAFNRFRQLQQQQNAPSWSQQPQQQQPQQPWQQQQPMPQQPWQNQPQQWQQQQPPPGQQQQPPQFKVELDPNEYDDQIVATFNAMNEFYQKQYQQLESTLQQAVQSFESFENQQQAEFSAWFDRSVTKLGDEVGSVFGKGPIERLSETSQEAQARIEAYQSYLDYLAFHGLPANHRDDELLNRVVRMTRGAPSEDRKQLSNQLKARSKGTIGRPSQKRSNAAATSEKDPFTGLSMSTVSDVQSMIDGMIGS